VRRRCGAPWALLGLTTALGFAPARAAPLDYALDVHAPDAADCSAVDELKAAIEARAGGLLFLDNPDPDRRIRVSVSRASSSWRARLQLLDAAGALVGERTIMSPGPSCAGLDDAVVTVLTTWVGVAEAPPPPQPTAAAALDAPPAPQGSQTPVDGPSPAVRSEAATMALPTSLVLEVGAGASVGALPGATLAAELALGLELGPYRLQFGVEVSPRSASDLGAGAAANFMAVLAEVSACRSAFDSGGTSLGFCAGVQAGLVGVSTTGLEQVRSRSEAVLLARLGPELRIDWTPDFGVALALRAVVPLVSARYYFVEAGRRRYYHTVDWGLSGMIGAYLRFGS
jgi:hypothetical protein